MLNRREFSKYFVTGGAALLAPSSLWPAGNPTASPQQPANQTFDLLIEGGTVIDPAQNIHAPLDVAIKNGKIAEVSKDIPKERALKVVSAKEKIVTPGFIDVHAHCYDGVGLGMNADRYCLTRGVTTAVDAGSAGYATFPNFRKYILNTSTTRIVALVNIGAIGTAMGPGSLENLDWVNPQLTAKAATDNKPVVVGIKIQLSKAITGNGKILPEAREARKRGVFFDPAQGQTHLNFDVADKCFQQNFLPDTISTDLTVVAVERRVYDLPTMVSKFMAMGIGLDQAIGMVTSNAARIFDYGAQVGTLRPGSEADVSIFELRDGEFEFEDSDGGKRTGRQMLVSKAVVRHGQVFVNAV